MSFASLRNFPLFRAQEAGLVAVLVLLSLGFSLVNPNFLSAGNLYNVSVAVAVVGIMAIGQCLVLIAREIDLSVGSVMALSALCGAAMTDAGLHPILGAILGIGVGALAGLVNGMLVVFGKVNSFIVTLGMLSMARGLTQVISGGLPIMVDQSITFMGQGEVFGLPVPVLIFIGLVIIGQLFLSRGVIGQRIQAVGDNAEAARLSGIPMPSTRISVFVICGLLSGVAGVVYSTQVGVAEAQAGTGMELDVIAAVVIGGASLSGGRGSILGAMLGAYLLGALRNAFILLELSPFLQQMSVGLVIVVAAIFDQVRQGAFSRPKPMVARMKAALGKQPRDPSEPEG